MVNSGSFDATNDSDEDVAALRRSLEADPESVNRADETEEDRPFPLHFAVRCGQDRHARLLIEFGAEIDAEDANGKTALHDALFGVSQIHTSLVRMLIELGADTKRILPEDLIWCLGQIEPETLRFLLGRFPRWLAARNSDGETSLHIAAMYGETENARILLDAGLEVDIAATCGLTPLHRAAGNDSALETIGLLLDRGADIEARTDIGSTPLTLAVNIGHHTGKFAAANLLLERGATLDLDSALEMNRVADAIRLLQADSPPTSRHRRTWPFVYAAECQSSELVRMLLRRGFDPGDARSTIHWNPNIPKTPETAEIDRLLFEAEKRKSHGR